MWSRAVWSEEGKSFEATIPTTWVEGKTTRWPRVANAQKHLDEKRNPDEKWLTFDLIKVKLKSGMHSYLMHGSGCVCVWWGGGGDI